MLPRQPPNPRRAARAAALALAFAAATATTADAKTFVVDHDRDRGHGTLRAALTKADRLRGKDRIEFSPRIHRVLIRHDLAVEGPVSILGTGRGRLRIIGPRDGGATLRFQPDGKGGKFLLRDVTLRRAGFIAKASDGEVDARITRTRLSGDSEVKRGVSLAGAYAGGALTLSRTTVSGFDTGVDADEGTLVIRDSAIKRNSTGVFVHRGRARIHEATISGNTAGGGIVIDYYADASITSSTISGNTKSAAGGRGTAGAGINAGYVASARVVNSTISGNRAEGAGSLGGGIYGNVDVVASTITDNSAERGGGIYATSAQAPGPVTVQDSIVAGNTAAADPECGGPPLRSRGHNLFGPAGCGAAAGTDLTGLDPLLGPLADNGGPTRTHALLPGSPALAAAKNVGLKTDQRGVRRGRSPDIGAYERRG